MRNLRINRKGKRAELELNCDFYPERTLKRAAKNFRKIFNAEIERKGKRFAVTLRLRGDKIGIEKATYDFINYLLAEVKNDMVRV